MRNSIDVFITVKIWKKKKPRNSRLAYYLFTNSWGWMLKNNSWMFYESTPFSLIIYTPIIPLLSLHILTQSPPIYTAQTEYISLKAHPPCHRVPEPGKGFTSCWINFHQSGLFTHVWPFHGHLACATMLNPSHYCNYENRVTERMHPVIRISFIRWSINHCYGDEIKLKHDATLVVYLATEHQNNYINLK